MEERDKAKKERKAEYNKTYYTANKERHAEYMRDWYKANPEYKKEWRSTTAKKHPDGYVSDASRCGENSPCWTGGGEYPRRVELKVNRLIALNDAGWACSACDGDADRVHHIDFSKDNHNIENLLPVCRPCHRKYHRNKERLEEVYA